MNASVSPGPVTSGSTNRRAFIYRHTVSFEETNVVGNVYFTRHVAWQGRCREMFLKEHAPTILNDIRRDLRLVTLRVTCEYFDELTAFDEIEIRMFLAHVRQHRIGLSFEIQKVRRDGSIRAATGFQEIGCMRATTKGLVPGHPPTPLVEALKPYAATL